MPEVLTGIQENDLDIFIKKLRSREIAMKMGTVWVIRTGKKENYWPNILHFTCKIN